MDSFISGLLITIFMILGVSDLRAQSMDTFSLEDYKWQNRVLLVFSPNTYQPDYRQQISDLRSAKDGIKERDLKVFYILKQSSPAVKGQVIPDEYHEEMYQDFDVSPADFKSILIGKDGTVKLQSGEAVSSENLFELIDSMPMRKLEMKNDG